MKNFDYKKILPYFAAIAILFIISIAYFSPVLDGKVLKQDDITRHVGMAKEISDFRTANNQEPLWTNSMFGGMPAFQISTLYNGNLVKYIDNIITFGLSGPVKYIFLLMIGFYILLLTLKVDKWIAIAGAIAYGFSSYFFIILAAGHNSKAHALGYIAPVFAGIILTYTGKRLLGAVLFALALALQIGANHLQITYYLAMTIVVYGIVEFAYSLKEKKFNEFFRSSLALLAASIISIGVNVAILWTTSEYSSFSTRGKSELTTNNQQKTSGLDKDYATDWSYGVSETFTLLIPNYKGGESTYIGKNETSLSNIDPKFTEQISQQNQYWGDQPFTSGPVYIGAIICFLFVLGAFIVEGRIKWFLVSATILSIILAWGKNFMPLTDFFLTHVPGYNKFRAVSMILIIAEFTMPLLAIIALKDIIKRPEILKEKAKYFYVAFGLTGGLALLFWLLPTTFNSFINNQEQQMFSEQITKIKSDGTKSDQVAQYVEYFNQLSTNLEAARISIFKADAIRSFLLILAAFVVLFLFNKKIINLKIVLSLITLLVLFDVWSINKRYLNDDSFISQRQLKAEFTPSAADEFILKDKSPDYRVLNVATNTFNDASTSYFHKSIGGYHGAKLKRYQELIENQLSQETQLFINTLKNTPTDSAIRVAFSQMPAVNMLNTKYIIYNPSAPALVNRYALGNAWFVNNIDQVDNSDIELAKIKTINPQITALVDKRYSNFLKSNKYISDKTDFVQLDEYKPNNLKYSYSTKSEQCIIFSEIYYDKGWNAYIDGNKTDYFRADYVLRGMIVPAGKHSIEFKFEPQSYKIGELISLISSIIMFIGIGVVIFLLLKKKISLCEE
ncbi:MAG: YfhO family protein [Bacteroidota bacterium]